MGDSEDPREKLLREALDAYKEEYRDLSDNWRTLDTKAQGAIAVSGLFLAAIFAFVRGMTESTAYLEKILVSCTSLLLTASIFFSLLVLRIQSVSSAPLGASLDELINDLLEAEDGMDIDRFLNFHRDHSNMWNITNREIEKVNERKALHLYRSQKILVLAIAVAALVTLIKVWN